MTSDKVVKVLKAELKLCKRIGISHHLPNKDMLYRIEAFSSAISFIQDYTRMRDYAQECCTKSSKAEKTISDYQKLRERISQEKIGEVLGKIEIPIDTNPMEVEETSIPAVIILKSVYGRIISQAIVTYLQQPTN